MAIMAKRKKSKIITSTDKNLKDLQHIQAKEFYKKVLIVQEEEKKRISRDLHDETGQIVIALGASLNIMEKEMRSGNTEKVLNIIDDNRKMIHEIAVRMKTMALNLRPPAFDILGLPSVLREYFSQCTQSSPIKIEFNENLKDKKLSETAEITLYRIVQEAVYNIQKHSKASLVKINLILDENELKLFIEDNGKGFDLKEYYNDVDATKMGLRGIRERVDMLNGTFSLDSAPGAGTKLKIILSLRKLLNADRGNAGR